MQNQAVADQRVNSRGNVIRGWFRKFTEHDDVIRSFRKSKGFTHKQKCLMGRHEILCHRVRNAKRNLSQGYVTQDFYKAAVARVERVQEKMLDAFIPAKVINAQFKLETSW